MIKINVQDKEISLLQVGSEIYVSLTDIIKGEDGSDHIKNWMRNRNTIEFLGLWESFNNENFKGVEFDTFKKEAGLNSFTMTPRKWIEATNAIGIVSKAGINGGTFAHKDIALEFCTWLSPVFKLLVLKEFQRLKEQEGLNGKWDIRRYLAKVNYRIQTDAIKDSLIPLQNIPKEKERFVYANEADLLYKVMFGYTSGEWRVKNPDLAEKGLNIRDVANTHQLIILANLESLNSMLISNGIIDQVQRFGILRNAAHTQLKSLKASSELENQLIESPHTKALPPKKDGIQLTFDDHLKGLLNVPPPKKDGK
ncbi:MAG: KilA-N domain-containing protein [Runella zeae]